MEHKKLYVIREQNDKTHIDKQIHLYGYSTNQMFDIWSILSHYWMISNKNNLVRCYWYALPNIENLLSSFGLPQGGIAFE